MKLSRVSPAVIVIVVVIIVLVALVRIFNKSDKNVNEIKQTKYQHNTTKSDGRANIINEDGVCKIWGSENRVDGGLEAEIGDLPCIALLEYLVEPNTYSFDCTGSLINHRYVLTAAQCLVTTKNKKLVNVRLGEYDVAKNPDCDADGQCQPEVINVGIELFIIHPDYIPNKMVNDIGLIRMSMDVKYEIYVINPICIPDETMSTAVGMVAKISGWGNDGEGKNSSILRSVWVHIIDSQVCQEMYTPQPILSSQLCAGGKADRNACFGDLGGPLLMRYDRRSYIEGIISSSSGCRRDGKPDIYTKVSHFNGWIRANLKP